MSYQFTDFWQPTKTESNAQGRNILIVDHSINIWMCMCDAAQSFKVLLRTFDVFPIPVESYKTWHHRLVT